MVTKIQKWGNSQGLRVAREILQEAHMSIGEVVNVRVKKGAIVIQPLKPLRGKYNLKELIAQMPKGYKPIEDWGKPMGREIW